MKKAHISLGVIVVNVNMKADVGVIFKVCEDGVQSSGNGIL